MDNAAIKVAAITSSANFNVFKEPRGFIKVIEFFLSIFAFGTCVNSGTTIQFNVLCGAGSSEIKQSVSFNYPFRLNELNIKRKYCSALPLNTTSPPDPGVYQVGSYAGGAQFFVAVGVLCFLYCLAALLLYTVFDNLWKSNDKIPLIDLFVTGLVAFFWLVSSSAWAKAVVDIKDVMDPNTILSRVVDCTSLGDVKCNVVKDGNYAEANVSVMFGFLNLFVWCGNIWFLYKETPFFANRQKSATGQETATPTQSVP